MSERSTLQTLAPFIEAQLSASHAATNAVIDNLEADVADWKQRYANLYDWLEDANQAVDSLKLGNILSRNAQYRSWAESNESKES